MQDVYILPKRLGINIQNSLTANIYLLLTIWFRLPG